MRYENGLKLLKYYSNIPDILMLTDNSNTTIKFVEMKKGSIVFKKASPPIWIQNMIEKAIEKDYTNKTIEEIKQQYKNQSNK